MFDIFIVNSGGTVQRNWLPEPIVVKIKTKINILAFADDVVINIESLENVKTLTKQKKNRIKEKWHKNEVHAFYKKPKLEGRASISLGAWIWTSWWI